MFCDYCGAEVSEEAKNCAACGKPIKRVASEAEVVVDSEPMHWMIRILYIAICFLLLMLCLLIVGFIANSLYFKNVVFTTTQLDMVYKICIALSVYALSGTFYLIKKNKF